MQCRIYETKIHSVDELKWRVIDWCGLEQSTIDMAIDRWRIEDFKRASDLKPEQQQQREREREMIGSPTEIH